MIEQIKNALSTVPNGIYTLLAPLLLAISTSFIKSKKIKELQDITERNIKLLKEVPGDSKLYESLEILVLLNLQEIKKEATRTRDWYSVFIALTVVALGAGAGVVAWNLWGGGGVGKLVAGGFWVVAVGLFFGGMGEVWKAWRGEGKRGEGS